MKDLQPSNLSIKGSYDIFSILNYIVVGTQKKYRVFGIGYVESDIANVTWKEWMFPIPARSNTPTVSCRPSESGPRTNSGELQIDSDWRAWA